MPIGMTAAQMVTFNIHDGPQGMGVEGEGFAGDDSLSPLPPVLMHGLPAVASLGFLSFLLSLSLFVFLIRKILIWCRQTKKIRSPNQFLILILSLLLADIQQSLGFLLNVQWVAHNKIDIQSPTCWAQGWFISTGA